jgi:hypothetical protein
MNLGTEDVVGGLFVPAPFMGLDKDSTITSRPSRRSPVVTSLKVPSLMPMVIGTL